MNDAALLDSLHAALRNPDLAWYTEFHAGESIVAGYLDSLTDPYDDDAIQVPEGWFRYSVVTREGDHALPWMEHWNEYEYSTPITSIGTAKGSRHTTCTAHRTSPA